MCLVMTEYIVPPLCYWCVL